MKKILIGIALFITGAIGLVLSACGAMFMDYTSKHGGATNNEFHLATAVTVLGAMMLIGSCVFVVRLVTRKRAPTVVSGTIRSTDDLPQ